MALFAVFCVARFARWLAPVKAAVPGICVLTSQTLEALLVHSLYDCIPEGGSMANADRVAQLSFEYVCELSTNGTDVIRTRRPQVSHLVLKLSIFASIHHVKQSLLQFRLPSSMRWTEQNAVSLTGCPASLPLAQMQGVEFVLETPREALRVTPRGIVPRCTATVAVATILERRAQNAGLSLLEKFFGWT